MSARRFPAAKGGPVPLYIPVLLVSVTSVVILSTDLYTPSLPHLPAYFGTDAATVQLTMSLNLAAFALGQLLLGPLSDRVGRRPVFVVALSAFVLTSIASALAPDIESLIVARTASKRLRRQRLLVRLGIRRNEPIDADTVVSPEAPADVQSEIRSVYGLLDRLPAEERVALVLRRVEGLDLAEIAEQMKLSLATVKRRIAAAEGRLERARQRG